MGRVYAGILGLLAFATVLVRSLRYSGPVETTLLIAMGSLIAFAIIGLLSGRLAAWIVEQSLQTQFAKLQEAAASKSNTSTS